MSVGVQVLIVITVVFLAAGVAVWAALTAAVHLFRWGHARLTAARNEAIAEARDRHPSTVAERYRLRQVMDAAWPADVVVVHAGGGWWSWPN